MMFSRQVVLVLILFVVFTTSVSAAGEGFNLLGTIGGDCFENALMNYTIYNQGTSTIVATDSGTASASGNFGIGISGGMLANTAYDINISATNPTCSPAVYGSIVTTNTTISNQLLVISGIAFDLTAPFYLVSPANNSIVSDNTTTFDWEGDYVNTNYTLEVDDDSDFSSPVITQTDIQATTYTLTAGQALSDGTYYYRVRALNATSDVIDTTETRTIDINTNGAVLSNPSPANYTWIGQSTSIIAIDTNIDAVCKYSQTQGENYTDKTTMSTTGGTTHQHTVSLGLEGTNIIYIQCNATLTGVVNGDDYAYYLRRDTTPPSEAGASINIESGASYSMDTNIDFVFSGFSDGGSGLSSYYYSYADYSLTSNGTSDAASPGQLINANQGAVTVYVWAEDQVGNIGSAVSDSITVDSQPPAFSTSSTRPSNLTMYDTGNFTINISITEPSGLFTTPRFKYKIGTDNYTAEENLTLLSTSGNTQLYTFTIQERSSPNTWFERNGELLYYVVTAEDIHTQTTSLTYTDFIDNVSTAPEFDAITDKHVLEDSELAFNISASDRDNSPLTYDCNITGATVTTVNDNLGTITWTPDNSMRGTHVYSCNVTDGEFTDTELFNITVRNVNDDPVLEAIGSLFAYEYAFFNYTINASDPDDDDLFYRTNSTMFSINSEGKIAFTPKFDDRGSHLFNISIDDDFGSYDYELVPFTVGWCGDNVCTDTYENCSVCATDCGVCEDEESKAILIDSRNCIDEAMDIQTVTLVQRASCEEKGMIVQGMEVCGEEVDVSLSVLKKTESNEWEEIAELITDEEGYATFTPDILGYYRVEFSSDNDLFTLFEVDSCLGGSAAETEDSSDDKKTTPLPSEGDEEPLILEEPGVVEDVAEWSFYAIALYFIVIPFLLVALIIAGMAFAYRMEQSKKESAFVKTVDHWLVQLHDFKVATLKKAHATPPFNYLLDFFALTKKHVLRYWNNLKKAVENYLAQTITFFGLKQKVSLPYFTAKMPGKRLHLLVAALLSMKWPKKSLESILGIIAQYTISTVYDVAALLLSNSLLVEFYDPHLQQAQTVQLLANKGLVFHRKRLTRVDVERLLQEKKPVVCLINELGDQNTIIQRLVAVVAFDQHMFYYHDYQGARQDVGVAKDEFMKSWRAAGSLALIVK